MNDHAIIQAVPESMLSQALTPQSIIAQVQLIQQVMSAVMKEGEHYGTIPGCGTKKTLMKSGAEKLCFTFQLVPTFEIQEKELPNHHREYTIKCRLHTRAGTLVAEGVGSGSTMESKYRYRKASAKCPECGAEAIIKGKEEYGGGWVCFKKKGGCGFRWPDGSKEIEGQETGKAENPDPADQYNTVLKMAKKRAHVDCTITACAASDIFTQDLDEDYQAAQAQEMTKAQASAAASSPNPADVPLHNEQARAEASRLWEELKKLDKHLANTIKRECGTDAEMMIQKFRKGLAALRKPMVGSVEAADADAEQYVVPDAEVSR